VLALQCDPHVIHQNDALVFQVLVGNVVENFDEVHSTALYYEARNFPLLLGQMRLIPGAFRVVKDILTGAGQFPDRP